MNPASRAGPLGLGIGAVERETGLTKDLLRVWERRYGFPTPQRDAYGERAYPLEQVDRLRLLRRLIDAGHRPGRVVRLPPEQLRALLDVPARPAGAAEPRPPGAFDDEGTLAQAAAGSAFGECAQVLEPLAGLLRANRVDALHQALAQAAVRLGLERFVRELCEPLTRHVGDEWARGALEIFQEHQYTELMQSLLRAAIARLPRAGSAPRVVLATLPIEAHGLGLLMAEALLTLEGCCCLALGTRLPAREIAAAAAAHQAEVVAVSCSGAPGANQVVDALAELRAALPAETALWVGGSHPVLLRRPPHGAVVVTGLGEIRGLVGAWRAAAQDAQGSALG